jgi:hypothetical protein
MSFNRGREPTKIADTYVAECIGTVIGYGDPGQQGKCTILKLHYNAEHDGERLRNIEQPDDCSVPPGYPRQKRVADLAGGAGNGNTLSE